MQRTSKVRNKRRIAIVLPPGDTSSGNANYLRNMVRALAGYSDALVPIVAGSPSAIEAFITPDVEGVERVQILSASKRSRTANSVRVNIPAALDRFAIDCVFETAALLSIRPQRPTIFWIPDLQHRALPQYFPILKRVKREIGFRVVIATERHILLSSQTALEEFVGAYGRHPRRVHVARFASVDTDAANENSASALQAPFFFVPNQFWRHKNHSLLLSALEICRGRQELPRIMCTGQTTDPRAPGYFDEFMAAVRAKGLGNAILVKGMVPYAHVRELYRDCISVINPSKYEGWSTSVEEAKVRGIPLIVSDIPVHREQLTGLSARFFGTSDAEALAAHLENATREGFTRTDPAELARQNRLRISNYISALEAAVEAACLTWRT